MLIYIIVYSILIFACFFDTKKFSYKRKKIVLVFLIIILTLFKGLRWETGTDWEQYYDVFCEAEWSNIFLLMRATGTPMEFGYVFVNVLSKNIYENYTLFLIITNLFILISYYSFSFKYSKYPIIVFTTILFSTNFFPVRQDLAISILLYAYHYLIIRKTKIFFILIFIATCIHNASFVFGILYFLRKFHFTLIKTYIILISCILLSTLASKVISLLISYSTFIPPVIAAKLQAYSYLEANDGLSQKGVAAIILVFIFVTLSIFYTNYLKMRNETEKLQYVNIFLTSTIILYASQFFFVGNFIYFARLGTCFSLVNNILLVNALILCCNLINKKLIEHNIAKIPPIFIVILFFLFRFSRMITLYPELHFPYHSIL